MKEIAGEMVDRIGPTAMLEQLAEECTECAQAALKLARKERGENPTPLKHSEAARHLLEEYTDVVQCAEELGMEPDRDQMARKTERFMDRWRAAGRET